MPKTPTKYFETAIQKQNCGKNFHCQFFQYFEELKRP